ncbi:MAG: DUF2279 domain-containing protein [Flavisolibacter sp.]
MRTVFFLCFFFTSLFAAAQQSYDSVATSAAIHNGRKWFAGGASVALYGGSFYYLNEAWYKKYPRSSFHTYNDSGEWMQMDKVGHAWTAYNTSRATTALWKWAGLPDKKAVVLGSLSGFAYLTVIEFLDGHSTEWGWSWSDIAANTSGSGLFALQQLAWGEQRIQYKFSSHKINYEPGLKARADDLFGSSLPERLLKDYNAQTYWFSFNLHLFLPESRLPRWLNVSVGMGAQNMLGGYENVAFDENGNKIFDRSDLRRYRQWYIAPDVDFTKIHTNSRFLRTTFELLNVLKCPAPALEFSNGRFRFHALTF